MEVSYYFPTEYDEAKREQIMKKAVWFYEKNDLPKEIVKPKSFLYDEFGKVSGYIYEQPESLTLSLKELFSPYYISKYHVDGKMLFSLAKKILILMSELSAREIYAGFIGLDSILVHRDRPGKEIAILHPENFQVENIPSEYPWYPSDSLLFHDDFELFDEEKQKKADAKLIYKILTVSEKNNAKIPPNSKTQEYSFLFWNILSREWKDYFLSLGDICPEYKDLLDRINESLEEESFYTAPEEKRITKEGISSFEKPEKETAYAAITILREAEKSAHDVSRELYLLQEKLEQHPHYEFLQAFILGDKHPFVRGFKKYENGFRSQLAHSIQEYSYGETLMIAAEMLEEALQRKEQPAALFVILDGEIKRDSMFLAALKRLEELKERGNTEIMVIPVREFRGEGYRKLLEICK